MPGTAVLGVGVMAKIVGHGSSYSLEVVSLLAENRGHGDNWCEQ